MLWNKRRRLPYNEQGRYFDEVNSIVLHEQSVTIFGLLAVFFGILATVF